MDSPAIINSNAFDWPGGEHWFCVRTKTKAEHLAAARLRELAIPEVFCPRIRFQKNTLRGRVWFAEALFPGYLFAKFDFLACHRAVRYAPHVLRLLSFGDKIPFIPDPTIRLLMREMGSAEITVQERELEPGEAVSVQTGPLRGLRGLITSFAPGRKRVEVLLDFLGQQRLVDLAEEAVMREEPPETLKGGEFARPGFVRKNDGDV